jgi:integrase
MRSGEAVRIDRDDVDWQEEVITIWRSKFGRSRAVPVHPTTLAALGRYADLRDECIPRPEALTFFISTVGTRLNNEDDKTFRRLARQVGLTSPSGRCRRRSPYAAAVHLHGSCSTRGHVLVFVGRP